MRPPKGYRSETRCLVMTLAAAALLLGAPAEGISASCDVSEADPGIPLTLRSSHCEPPPWTVLCGDPAEDVPALDPESTDFFAGRAMRNDDLTQSFQLSLPYGKKPLDQPYSRQKRSVVLLL